LKASYSDIREKLGEPEWFDPNGVPRYCPFHPDALGPYEKFVAFVLIACQSCGQRFHVAVSQRLWDGPFVFPTPEGIGAFHYGDPPIHGCTGDTMNCDTVRVVEFWRRDASRFAWARDDVYEISYPEGGDDAA
jgi:hypothetical protein